LAEHMPVLRATQTSVGGISSPVISPCGEDYSTVMQGLILLAIKQIRKLSANTVVMDCVCSYYYRFGA
jgi:beta-N-acetylhexosaminidase